MTDAATAGQPDVGPTNLLWKPTDWTPLQRMLAIWGLLMLTLAFALFCGALLVWSLQFRALDVVIPIGVCLLCLGTALLGAAYWYAFLRASNRIGADGGNTGLAAFILLGLVGGLGLLPLAGPLLSLFLAPPILFSDWSTFNFFACTVATGLSLLFSAALSLREGSLAQRPIRDSSAPGSALGASVTGMRLVLRWAVTVLARNGWLLIGAPLVVLVNLEYQVGGTEGSLVISHSSAQAPALAAGLAATFFLLAALSELTHRG